VTRKTTATQYSPLYQQVYQRILGRISEGYWKAGDSLPSEFALADEFGVSQGTVRKSLNQLVKDNIVRRQQGKGTYVSEHNTEASLYRFFRYRQAGGERLIPETRVLAKRVRKSNAGERQSFKLSSNHKVLEITRLRSLKNVPIIYEVVSVPLVLFPGIENYKALPDSLYAFYQEAFGVSISKVQDELRAVKLPAKVTKHLRLSGDTAILQTHRLSIDLNARVVERSIAYCNTQDFVYSASFQ